MHWLNTLYSTALLLSIAQHMQQSSAQLVQIPSIKSFSGSVSNFVVDTSIQIVVDVDFAHNFTGGFPTLVGFAQTFREDLISVTGFSNISEVQTGKVSADTTTSTVFLTLGPSSSSNLTLFNGKSTGEGYEFEVAQKLYTIRGVEAIGAWWGMLFVLSVRLPSFKKLQELGRFCNKSSFQLSMDLTLL